MPSDHEQLAASLDLAGLTVSASEAHGMICGVLCMRATSGRDPNIVEMLVSGSGPAAVSGNAAGDTVGRLLRHVSDDTERALAGADFGFRLLLPSDRQTIAERTEALADWCAGFTLGLLHDRKVDVDELPADAAEVVRDLLAIGEAEAGAAEAEEEERALAELEEYVRVGVQLIYEELQAGSKARGAAPEVL